MVNLNSLIGSVVMLIVLFLLINNATNFNSIVRTGGSVVGNTIAILQGRDANIISATRPSVFV